METTTNEMQDDTIIINGVNVKEEVVRLEKDEKINLLRIIAHAFK
jgi:hypothetical protein